MVTRREPPNSASRAYPSNYLVRPILTGWEHAGDAIAPFLQTPNPVSFGVSPKLHQGGCVGVLGFSGNWTLNPLAELDSLPGPLCVILA